MSNDKIAESAVPTKKYFSNYVAWTNHYSCIYTHIFGWDLQLNAYA